jgi:hypothetical protein
MFIEIYENDKIDFDWRIFSVLNYSGIILNHLKPTNRKESLKEVKILMSTLLKLAKSAVSFRIYAQTYIILAQIEMIENNFTQARDYFLKAEKISETKGLKVLSKIKNYYLNRDYFKKNTEKKDSIFDDLNQEINEMILIRS